MDLLPSWFLEMESSKVAHSSSGCPYEEHLVAVKDSYQWYSFVQCTQKNAQVSAALSESLYLNRDLRVQENVERFLSVVGEFFLVISFLLSRFLTLFLV